MFYQYCCTELKSGLHRETKKEDCYLSKKDGKKKHTHTHTDTHTPQYIYYIYIYIYMQIQQKYKKQ